MSRISESYHVYVVHINESWVAHIEFVGINKWWVADVKFVYVEFVNVDVCRVRAYRVHGWPGFPHFSECVSAYVCACIDAYITGLNVLAKNRRNWQVNFIDSGLTVAKTRFQTFLWSKSVLFKWKCQIREFHARGMERGEVLTSIVGDKTRLRFWNKHQKIELLFTQLARYNRMHKRVIKYQNTIPEKLANK